MTKDSYVFFLQELAFSSFQRMASVLKRESHNNVGFMVVKDTVSSILSGIANVLQSSASLADVDATDSKENITGYTGNSTKSGVVSVKESVSYQNSFPFLCFILFAFTIAMFSILSSTSLTYKLSQAQKWSSQAGWFKAQGFGFELCNFAVTFIFYIFLAFYFKFEQS